MKIIIGSDHAGFLAKEDLKKYLTKKGHEVTDLGPADEQSVDYSDYGIAVGKAVVQNKADFGIVICGTGIGISIAANKVPGVRCALLYNEEVAKLAKEHNDANVIAFGARFMSVALMHKMLDAYMAATFQGGRHARRIQKISDQEGR